MSDFVSCPRCEQGQVVMKEIAATGERVYVCEECEAAWSGIEPSATAFVDVGALLMERDLEPLWSELADPSSNPFRLEARATLPPAGECGSGGRDGFALRESDRRGYGGPYGPST